ncbi:MAG: phosphoribosylamine--glycine ligase, partial [Pseudomonadales bacterium]
LPMATSQDHKRIGEGDTGPNTGGMGAYSPAPVVTAEVHDRIMREVIEPTVAGMAAEGNTYSGFLYAGLMIDAQGSPKVIEYNCRFGDPETQPIMMRMQSDLTELCIATVDKQLAGQSVQWTNASALGVVLAAGGYPESYKKGLEIDGLNAIHDDNCKVFHAGTAQENTSVLTNGGRVLCVTALGESVEKAQTLAYKNASKISWPGVQLRKDIGYRAVARERLKS